MIDLRCGDCLEVMRDIPDASVHACVTDPPYGLAFMGKKWDYDVPTEDVWREVLRILKPGGFLLSFSGTRTYHRMTVRIEDAGFEIRDMVQWLYGSGFPKSHDVSKAIDREAGAERERIRPVLNRAGNGAEGTNALGGSWQEEPWETAPATDAAKQWEGFGTALKPANEPVCVARKPLIGTVAQNVLAHGCGGLNIDGCRVGTDGATRKANTDECSDSVKCYGNGLNGGGVELVPGLGRWPANVVHDGSDEVLALFPNSEAGKERSTRGTGGIWSKSSGTPCGPQYGDMGSAARFFKEAQWTQEDVNCAERNFCLQNEVVVSALTHVVARSMPELALSLRDYRAPSTAVTESELRSVCGSVTELIRFTVQKCLQEQRPQSTSLTDNHARYAVTQKQTGIMTITVSLLRLDGFADPVTFNITDESTALGEKGSAPSRAFYSAKADRAEREKGVESPVVSAKRTQDGGDDTRGRPIPANRNHHPTVKPVDLMRWLVRLVCPPGGVVIDPYTGSGTTGVACRLEGFGFIGIDIEPAYIDMARQRIAAETPSLFTQEAV